MDLSTSFVIGLRHGHRMCGQGFSPLSVRTAILIVAIVLAGSLSRAAAQDDAPMSIAAESHLPNAVGQYVQADAISVRISQLCVDLKSADSQVRMKAANALAQFGPVAASAAPDLVRLFNDRDDSVRSSAINALSSLGSKALPPVYGALRTGDENTRVLAVITLTKMHRFAKKDGEDALLRALQDSSHSVKTTAASAVSQELRLDRAIPVLIRMATAEKTDQVRTHVINAIAHFGETAKDCKATLVEILSDRDNSPNQRNAAVRSLAKIVGQDEEIRMFLVKKLADPLELPSIRSGIAVGFGSNPKLGAASAGDIYDILRKMQESTTMFDPAVAEGCLKAIRMLGAQKDMIPAFSAALSDSRSKYRDDAIVDTLHSIAQLGAEAKELSPLVLSHIRAINLKTNPAAISAFCSITPRDQAIAALNKIADSLVLPDLSSRRLHNRIADALVGLMR